MLNISCKQIRFTRPESSFWERMLANETLPTYDNLEKLVIGCEIIAALDDLDLLAA